MIRVIKTPVKAGTTSEPMSDLTALMQRPVKKAPPSVSKKPALTGNGGSSKMSTEELTQVIAVSRGHQNQACKENTKGSGRTSIPSGASLTVTVVGPTGVLDGDIIWTVDGKQAGVVATKPPAYEGVPVELKTLPPTGRSGDGGSETLDGSTGPVLSIRHRY